MNVLTTIPKSKYGSWESVEGALSGCDGSKMGGFWLVNCHVLPKKTGIGDLCYMIFDNWVRGYMDIVDIAPTESYRHLHRIGKKRTTSSLILANWHPIAYQEHIGFQGWRYTELK